MLAPRWGILTPRCFPDRKKTTVAFLHEYIHLQCVCDMCYTAVKSVLNLPWSDEHNLLRNWCLHIEIKVVVSPVLAVFEHISVDGGTPARTARMELQPHMLSSLAVVIDMVGNALAGSPITALSAVSGDWSSCVRSRVPWGRSSRGSETTNVHP